MRISDWSSDVCSSDLAALERAGMPGGADLVRLNGAAMVLGGLALGAGILPRAASIGLIASLVPTTVVGHPFWREQDAAARNAHTLQFMKNLSMLGRLLIAASPPEPGPTLDPTPPSLRACQCRPPR